MSQVDLRKLQDPLTLRLGAYPKRGDQFDALWKIIRVLVKRLPPEYLAEIPPDALEVMGQVAEAKAKFKKRKD